VRILVSLLVGVALFWLVVSFAITWSAKEHADANFACGSATALLGLWTSQKIIVHISNDGRDVTVLVSGASWLSRLTKKSRIDIGMAAWCQVESLGKGGMVKIRGDRGEDLGQVVGGTWSSKLYGE
jgi:DMSO/TMAO reductase YedYZ heme-binding membrane subunit